MTVLVGYAILFYSLEQIRSETFRGLLLLLFESTKPSRPGNTTGDKGQIPSQQHPTTIVAFLGSEGFYHTIYYIY